MSRWPTVALVMLLYVSLDFSLPMMPGAFVFDVADSVESLQTQRGRSAAEVCPMHAMGSSLAPQQRVGVDDPRPVQRRVRAPRSRPPVNVLPRAVLPPPPPSEDPH